MGDEQESRADRAHRLAADVGRLVPELRPDQVMVVVGPVIDQATALTKETEDHFAQAKNEVDVTAIVSVMVQGALAAICESHVEGDLRMRLYQAGRKIGDFVTERMQQNIEAAVEQQRKDTLS